MKREFDIENYHFKLEPTTRGGLSVNGQKAKYDITALIPEQDGSFSVSFIGVCRTLSEGFIISSNFVKEEKAEKGMIPIEKALEAYKTVRDYCMQQKNNCEGCLFECMDDGKCIFEFESVPCSWQQLDLD